MVGNARGLRPVSDKNRLNRKHIEPVDLGKVNAIHPVEVSAEINERSVLGFFLSLFEGREGIGLQVRLRIEAAEKIVKQSRYRGDSPSKCGLAISA